MRVNRYRNRDETANIPRLKGTWKGSWALLLYLAMGSPAYGQEVPETTEVRTRRSKSVEIQPEKTGPKATPPEVNENSNPVEDGTKTGSGDARRAAFQPSSTGLRITGVRLWIWPRGMMFRRTTGTRMGNWPLDWTCTRCSRPERRISEFSPVRCTGCA